MSSAEIAFSYAGDLWRVPRQGGDATRLTSGAGVETDPVFSPDGSRILFTGEYDGNVDVFIMPAAGGTPRRLTYHPSREWAAAWTPDGKRVVFGSSRANPADGDRLFTMPAGGAFPEEIPLPMADGMASYSPDASRLAYVPVFQWQKAWKRYRGGQTTWVAIADLSDSSVVSIPRESSNDFNPMWVGSSIYFLSDRNGPVSLFCYDTRTRQVKQVIENRGLDFKSASAGPDAIVYEQFGGLHLFDLKSGKSRPVGVRVAGDFPEVRPRFVNVSKRLRNPDVSPTGARAVFEARGEILTVPAEKGDPRNLTNSPSVHERDPAWSPDGKTIAYFSDESGEYTLHLRDQNGMGEARKIALKPAYYFTPRWSPDSRKISFIDNHLNIWYLDLDRKTPVLVDKDDYMSDSGLAPVWSLDSQWLAYRKSLRNSLSAIYLYSLAGAKGVQVTDGMSEAKDPVFDRNGKYLYFSASTDSGAAMQPDVLSRSHPVTRSIYVVVLSKKEPSPLAPLSDEEKPAGKPDEAAKGREGEGAKKVEVHVDLEGIGQRILALPMPPRRYEGLAAGKPGVLFAVESPDPPPGAERTATVHRFDLAKQKADVAIAGVRSFRMSFNGEKMLYQQGDRWFIAPPPPMKDSTAPSPPQPEPENEPLKTAGLEVHVDPPAEWKQMYREVWRLQREYFYDTNYHGLDLQAAQERYEPYLRNLASRRDLNYLFAEMLGELSVGHVFVMAGDMPEVKRVSTGLLGADYRIENGRYRFAKVYDGENWNPDLKAPLTQPGVNVAAGDYLLAVNGRELRASDNVFSFFEATAGKSVVLKVGPDASGANSREVSVVPVPDEERLRHLAWIEDNRRTVDRMTKGRVAYIHLPDTSQGAYRNFNRYFFAQVGKEAAIIDDRFNHGGQLATDIIEHLRRPMMSVITPREGGEMYQPLGAIFGPKVMIINEFAGSGGDALPWYFRRFGVGRLIGKRTWGGLVGMSGSPGLMDGGIVTVPTALVRNPDGVWEVENLGVAPDIEVEMDPKAVRQGRDPQLEKAVQIIMEELQRNPYPKAKPPMYPNYHKQHPTRG